MKEPFIELDDGKFYRKPLYLMLNTMVSCRFSLKPIHWTICNHPMFCPGTPQLAKSPPRRRLWLTSYPSDKFPVGCWVYSATDLLGFFYGSQKRGQTTLRCEHLWTYVNICEHVKSPNDDEPLHLIGFKFFWDKPKCLCNIGYRYVWIPSAILRCQFSRTAWWARPMSFTVLPQSSALSTRFDLFSYV